MKRPLLASLLLFALCLPCAAQAAPKIESWETDNGLRVLYVRTPDLPMIDLRLTFDAAASRDGERPGLAALTNALLDEGAAGMDADTIARRFAEVGARFGSDALRDMAWLSLRSLTDPDWFEPALSTFVAVIGDPEFREADLERLRRQTLTALRDEAQDPGSVASRAFYEAVFGDHPYAVNTTGTVESVQAITRAEVQAHYARYYVARNAVLGIAGAVDRAEAERIAGRIAGALEAGEPAPPIPPVSALEAAADARIAFPSEQAHVIMGAPGMRRTDSDYYALYLGNHVLGGSGFQSRITREIRSDRGLAYSAYSYFLPMASEGPFLMGLQTRVDQAEEAVDIVRETLAEFIENGPSAKELAASKANITGGFPLRTASNANIAEYLALIGFYDMPLDYLDTFIARIDAVTAQDIREAFQRRLDADRLVTVVVGGESS